MEVLTTNEYGFIGKPLILSFSSAGGTHLGLVALRCTQVCELLGSYNPTPFFLKKKSSCRMMLEQITKVCYNCNTRGLIFPYGLTQCGASPHVHSTVLPVSSLHYVKKLTWRCYVWKFKAHKLGPTNSDCKPNQEKPFPSGSGLVLGRAQV